MRVYPKTQIIDDINSFVLCDKDDTILTYITIEDNSIATYLNYDDLTYVRDKDGEVFITYSSIINKFK